MRDAHQAVIDRNLTVARRLAEGVLGGPLAARPKLSRRMMKLRWTLCHSARGRGARRGWLAACAGAWLLLAIVPAQADPVTQWTRLADALGHGAANWRTLAIMHQAMHDAWNAADPHYRRWFPPATGEPPGTGVSAQAAMASAARYVMVALQPSDEAEIDLLLNQEFRRIGDSAASRAGLNLGDAVGKEAIARRQGDGFYRRHQFAQAQGAGRWQATPQEFQTSGTTQTHPFLFANPLDAALPPPPAPGSATFARELDESMRVGGLQSRDRMMAQSDAAFFWAYQSSQRGFVILAATMLEQHPRRGGLAEEARFMSQLTAAMADSAIVVWTEKEKWSRWRPVTAIRALVPSQAQWLPLIDTPPHPEYPSGHAADCFTGAMIIAAEFPDVRTPIDYVAQTGRPANDTIGMGQHAQGFEPGEDHVRRFANVGVAAEECADSRIWAGAHFRSSDEASRMLAAELSRRARAAVPPR